MSLLHNIWVDLKCERCGKIHETVIRFTCSSEIEDYRPGERVPDGEDLIVGMIYEGNADRYCRPCYRKWGDAQAMFSYESLAELLEQGRVSARDPVSGVTLSQQDVLEYGRRYIEEEQSTCLYVTMPFFTELELFLNGEPVILSDEDPIFGDKNWEEFLEVICPLLDRRLRDDGWTDPTWEDFLMHLDDNRRIVVEDLSGKRLFSGGERR
jgi:hypothetical protein